MRLEPIDMSTQAPVPEIATAGELVALMGSYRKGGVLDRTVEAVLEGARAAGARTRKIDLVDRHVEFCRNCRACCREPGPRRGTCVIEDDVDGVLRALEAADGVVLGAPVNFGDVNALTRRLQERMLGYVHWPPGQAAPVLRDKRRTKRAVLVTSSAAPGWMTRTLARPLRTLRQMSRLLGARPVGSLVVGLAAEPGCEPGPRSMRRARRLGRRLAGR